MFAKIAFSLNLLTVFAKGLELLDDYDHEELDIIGKSQQTTVLPSYDDYIIDFEGFYNTYGVSLNFPTPDSEGWKYVNETQNAGIAENANLFFSNILKPISCK